MRVCRSRGDGRASRGRARAARGRAVTSTTMGAAPIDSTSSRTRRMPSAAPRSAASSKTSSRGERCASTSKNLPQHRARDALEGARVLVDGLGQGRAARTSAPGTRRGSAGSPRTRRSPNSSLTWARISFACVRVGRPRSARGASRRILREGPLDARLGRHAPRKARRSGSARAGPRGPRSRGRDLPTPALPMTVTSCGRASSIARRTAWKIASRSCDAADERGLPRTPPPSRPALLSIVIGSVSLSFTRVRAASRAFDSKRGRRPPCVRSRPRRPAPAALGRAQPVEAQTVSHEPARPTRPAYAAPPPPGDAARAQVGIASRAKLLSLARLNEKYAPRTVALVALASLVVGFVASSAAAWPCCGPGARDRGPPSPPRRVRAHPRATRAPPPTDAGTPAAERRRSPRAAASPVTRATPAPPAREPVPAAGSPSAPRAPRGVSTRATRRRFPAPVRPAREARPSHRDEGRGHRRVRAGRSHGRLSLVLDFRFSTGSCAAGAAESNVPNAGNVSACVKSAISPLPFATLPTSTTGTWSSSRSTGRGRAGHGARGTGHTRAWDERGRAGPRGRGGPTARSGPGPPARSMVATRWRKGPARRSWHSSTARSGFPVAVATRWVRAPGPTRGALPPTRGARGGRGGPRAHLAVEPPRPRATAQSIQQPLQHARQRPLGLPRAAARCEKRSSTIESATRVPGP